MNGEQALSLTPALDAAVAQLQELIRERYPEATFWVMKSPENPETVLLKPVIDVVDRDDVMDVVIDRLVELQATEQLPLFVVPVCHHAGAGPSAPRCLPTGRALGVCGRSRLPQRPDHWPV